MSYILQALDKSAATRDTAREQHSPATLAAPGPRRSFQRRYYAGFAILLIFVILLISFNAWNFKTETGNRAASPETAKTTRQTLPSSAPAVTNIPPPASAQSQEPPQTSTPNPATSNPAIPQTASPPSTPSALSFAVQSHLKPATTWQTARVIGIHSGCEIEISTETSSRRVRLSGVRCPGEAPFDKLARRFTTRMIFTHTIEFTESLSGQNQILIRMANKKLLNRLLISRGLGWASSPAFAADERMAKQSQQGIWLAAQP